MRSYQLPNIFPIQHSTAELAADLTNQIQLRRNGSDAEAMISQCLLPIETASCLHAQGALPSGESISVVQEQDRTEVKGPQRKKTRSKRNRFFWVPILVFKTLSTNGSKGVLKAAPKSSFQWGNCSRFRGQLHIFITNYFLLIQINLFASPPAPSAT